jgi:glycosyltransferase involved in cell wall biosynthesis
VSYKFSIVICSYNGAEYIAEALQSLEALNYPKASYEVIVVNDGSTDATASIVSKFKHVKLVNRAARQGVGSARNAGLEKASGKWVAYLDDDCVASQDWLKHIEKSFDEEEAIAIGGHVAPKTTQYLMQRYLFLSGYGEPARFPERTPKIFFDGFTIYIKHNYQHRLKSLPDSIVVNKICGANSVFQRNALLAIGGYNDTLTAAEDSDVCVRLYQKYPHCQIRYNAKAVVWHGYGSSVTDYLGKQLKRQFAISRYYYQLGTTPPILPFPVVILLVTLGAILISGWLALLMLVILPLILYGWWVAYAVTKRSPEAVLYSYIEAIEESLSYVGLLHQLALIKQGRQR